MIPLYLYPCDSSKRLPLDDDKQENITPSFRQWIDNHYHRAFTPENILGYIYAIMHSPTYRGEYVEFLKRDFPRIPFTQDTQTFKRLSYLGWELIQTHLMKNIPALGLGDYIGQGNHTVDKISYQSADQHLFINATQYFSNVPNEVFDFHIGGYQVLSKYLKSRKGHPLTQENITHIENIVNILAFTLQQMEKIDKIYHTINMTEK